VLSSRARRALLVLAGALAPLTVPAAALAVEPTSNITTPAGLTLPFGEEKATITVAGTAENLPGTTVDIRCYTGPEVGSYLRLASSVPVAGNTFTTPVTLSFFYGPCTLRAVPHETEAEEKVSTLKLPPGVKEPFEGPRIAASFFTKEATLLYAASTTTVGAMIFESSGTYGLESVLTSPTTLYNSHFFYGEADLTPYPPIKSRTSLQVDGANAYVPYGAREVEREIKAGPLTGTPTMTASDEFNAATHQITIHEEDPVVRCVPSTAFPPTKASCTSFASTGVTLVRTWQSSNEDHLASLTETWRSTDGAAHNVNARYYTEMWSATHGAWLFPGEGAFAATHTGESKTVPAGAGMLLYKAKASTPEAGDNENPQGAIAYDAAPNEPVAVTTGTAGAGVNVMEVPYQRTVPAGGSSTLRMAFAQAFSMPEAQALAAAALASYHPSVAIASPANGATIMNASQSVTVSGTASDTVALSSLSVNGAAVAVGAGGAWSTSVALKPGVNTITATATDQAGLSASSAIAVTYKLPPATASVVGHASGAKGQVVFTIACHGLAGTSCKVHATLTTVEKIRRGRLVGIAAKVKTRSKTITIASVTVTIPAGKTAKITLKPNATGRRLLKRFGKLPARLTAVLEAEGVRTKVIAQNITIKPVPKKHKRKH
jgi:hypothetical protein